MSSLMVLVFALLLLILSLSFKTSMGLGLTGPMSFGKSILVVPREVFVKLHLLKEGRRKYHLRLRKIALIASLILFVVAIIFQTDLGIPDALFESFLKIIGFIAAIAGIADVVFGWRISEIVFAPKPESADYDRVAERVAQVFQYAGINIDSLDDFMQHIHLIIHLLPYEYVSEKREEELMDLQLDPEDFVGDPQLNMRAAGQLTLFLMQRMIQPGQIVPDSVSGQTVANKRRRQTKKKKK